MGGTQQIWRVKLNADERRAVKQSIDTGMSEFDAVRQVLIGSMRPLAAIPAPPLSVQATNAPPLSRAERDALITMIQSGLNPMEQFQRDHSLNDCAMAIIGQLDETWRTWIQEVAEITLKIPLWQVIAGTLQISCDRGEIQAALIDPRWHEEGVDAMPTEVVCEICHSTFAPEKVNQKVCSNRCGAELERRVNVS